MNKERLFRYWIYVALPAVILLYYNQSANWHYHITSEGIVVEHAHPFANNMIPGTPYQDHEHSDFEYLVLAQVMQTTGFVVMILFLLAALLSGIRKTTPLPLPLALAGHDPSPNPVRGPPAII